MSRASSPVGDIESGSGGGEGHFGRTRSETFQESQGGFNSQDGSEGLYSLYLEYAEEKDNGMADRWQKEAEGILIFAGLFSAVVATLLSITIPDLKPSPQGTSEFHLNICQSRSNFHESDSCQPSLSRVSPVVDSSMSSPPRSAIWVNSLWFLSLAISLTCAMLATFLQKWARRYIRVTQQSRYTPPQRARVRAFFSDGVDRWHVSWAVEALPTLLHLSFFLFFVGLLVFLFSINRFILDTVMWWVLLSMMAYLTITLLPVFKPNSPYYAPLSSPIWYLYVTIPYAVLTTLSSVIGCFHFNTSVRFRRLEDHYRYQFRHNRFLEDAEKRTEEIDGKRASETDVRVLETSLNLISEDGGWERYFGAIPGFIRSKQVDGIVKREFRIKFSQALGGFLDRTFSYKSVDEPLVRDRRFVISLDAAHALLGFDGVFQIVWDFLRGRWLEVPANDTAPNVLGDGVWETFFSVIPGVFNGVKDHLPEEFWERFGQALGGFLDRTLSFNSVTESVRSRRLIICLNATHAAFGVNSVSQIFTDVFSGRWPELLQSVEIGHSLRRWSDSADKRFTWDVRRAVAQIVVNVRERDDGWISLVKSEYGIVGHVLRDYIGHGDSVLLSILTHMTRQAFHTRSWTPWILSSLSEFNIRDTLPDLQHAFCALWNDIVIEASNEGPESIPVRILREIRHACIALHQDTNAVLTTFSASTHHFDPVLGQPRSYLVCKIASHRQSLTMRTPFAGSLTARSPSFIQLDQLSATSSSHTSSVESDHTPPQRAEEGNIVLESSSATDNTPHPSHTQEFTPPPPAIDSVPIAQAASTTGSSVPGNIGKVVTQDPDLLVSGEASHDPCQQPSLPATEITAAANIVRPDDPTPHLHLLMSETGEIPLAPAETSLTSTRPNSVPAAIPPSSGQSSSFVPDPGDDPDPLQASVSSATLSHPLENNKQQNAIVPCASDTDETSSVLPTIIVSDSLSSRILHPIHSYGMTIAEPSSSVESSSIHPDHVTHAPRLPPSSLTTTGSCISPKVSSTIGTPSPHEDTHDPNPPMTALHHPTLTAMPARDIVTNALPLEDRVRRDPEKS